MILKMLIFFLRRASSKCNAIYPISSSLKLFPLEVRSRYNVVLRNPLIDKIKQQNILAYQLAVAACNHLERTSNGIRCKSK